MISLYEKPLEYYAPKNLFGVGRWGQHRYQNADASMYEAMKFVEKRVKLDC